MKIEKMFLCLSLLLVLSITSFAMSPEQNKFEKGYRDCNRFEKQNCPAQFQQCEIFMLLESGLEIKNAPMHNNFKKGCDLREEYNLRFLKDLSKEQKDKIKQISEANREINEATRTDIKNKFDELDKELSKDKYNKKAITKLTKEINELCNKKIDAKISEKQQIRDVLTSEQFSKMIKEPTKYDIFAERFNLTQEQQEKVETLFEKNKVVLDSIKKDLGDKNLALEQELDKEQANFDTINNLSDEIAELSKKKIKVVIDTKSELKKILTDEQFNKVIKNKKYIKPQPIPVPKPIKPIAEEK